VTAADRIAWPGHATVAIELGGVRLLTDPLLRGRIGPLRRHGPVPSADLTRELDALLVSHLHHDHADAPSLRRIDRDVPALVARGTGAFFSRLGFTAVTELAPGESSRVGPLTVTAVEANHPNGGRLLERRSAAVGFVVEGPGRVEGSEQAERETSPPRRRVYFAGDTDLFEGMRDLAGNLDVALLPVWGWGTSIGAGHLDPERAARAAALLAPRIAIPIHWGTLYPLGLARLRPGPLRAPPREFAATARELAPQVEVRVLSPGESTSLA
jgi:L-ascorbate metabolism protein UlaG (beta-lactamase superfamily)